MTLSSLLSQVILGIQLNNNIINEDGKALTAIPGVGTKTANRIILELKDKVSSEGISQDLNLGNIKDKQLFSDSVNALFHIFKLSILFIE